MKKEEFLKSLVFVIDSREQLPYEFKDRNTKTSCLQVGDYSIEGLESLVAIERKSIGDLIGSICKGRERFERELKKSRSLEYFALVCECSLSDIAMGKYISNMNPKAAIQSILAFSVRYRMPVFWAENRRLAERITESLLEKFALQNWKKEDKK